MAGTSPAMTREKRLDLTERGSVLPFLITAGLATFAILALPRAAFGDEGSLE